MENFCYCVSLTKGGKIIGFLCVAFSLISMVILGTYLLTDLDEVVGELTAKNVDATIVKKNESSESYKMKTLKKS